MKVLVAALLIMSFIACNQADQCRWQTVSEMEQVDVTKCKVDAWFLYARKYSAGLDSFRKRNGIPKLPKNFVGVVFSVNNQIRWQNKEAVEQIENDTNYKRPYMRWKDLEWQGDSLKYDRTIFRSMDSVDSYLTIVYFLDTISTVRNYKFSYLYTDDSLLTENADGSLNLSGEQADSILKKWKIDH